MLDLLIEKLTSQSKQTNKQPRQNKQRKHKYLNKVIKLNWQKREKDGKTSSQEGKKPLPEPVGTWTGAAVALYTDCVGAYTAAVGTGAGSITGATAVALNV